MTLCPYFSSSAKVWDDIQWVYGIEEEIGRAHV
jgi:hypothetical protein